MARVMDKSLELHYICLSSCQNGGMQDMGKEDLHPARLGARFDSKTSLDLRLAFGCGSRAKISQRERHVLAELGHEMQ